MIQPREEYPRPQLKRDEWINLNGQWDFKFDDDDIGLKEKWYLKDSKDKINDKIVVPYTYQCEMSGVNNQDFHDIIWYRKDFIQNEKFDATNLNFGAVDYYCQVWINGLYIGENEGGHTPFFFDIAPFIKVGKNEIVLRVYDPSKDLELPRGKQYWREKSEGIFYTRTSGIWQTVWIENLSKIHLSRLWLTPDIDKKMLFIDFELSKFSLDTEIELEISLENKLLVKERFRVLKERGKKGIYLDQGVHDVWQFYEMWAWSPENPVLFDLKLTVISNSDVKDVVESYFGMRKVEIVDGQFLLNNRPYFQKMLLDQGYWEQSLLTAPTDKDFILDIELAKKMGFNGVRKHMKVEDPRYLYHADRLGFLVWGEMAAGYVYSRTYAERMVKEWIKVIKRDYNHPCIVAWTPLNESWGVDDIMNNQEEMAHSASLYYLTKSFDTTRPVISNDGWDHVKTDLLTIHDYEYSYEVLSERYSDLDSLLKDRPAGRGLFAKGFKYEGQPIIVSEFGGISFQKGKWDGWGYSAATSEEDFIKRYNDVIKPMLDSKIVQGFVYTQITDVEQEINGLLTYDRKPKVDLNIIKEINEGRYKG